MGSRECRPSVGLSRLRPSWWVQQAKGAVCDKAMDRFPEAKAEIQREINDLEAITGETG